MKRQILLFLIIITSSTLSLNKGLNTRKIMLVLAGILILFSTLSFGQHHTASIPKNGHIYVNPEHGSNGNNGTKETPLQTLHEAARRLNSANGKGSITIYLSEGIHGLDATVTFHPANWHFTKSERLTIRAQTLPDDAEWN